MLPALATAPIINIDRAVMRRFVSGLDARGAGQATIRIALHIARSVLELAVDAGALKANPAVGVKIPGP